MGRYGPRLKCVNVCGHIWKKETKNTKWPFSKDILYISSFSTIRTNFNFRTSQTYWTYKKSSDDNKHISAWLVSNQFQKIAIWSFKIHNTTKLYIYYFIFVFKTFDFECIGWRLFQKWDVCNTFYIYICITITGLIPLMVNY